MNILPSGYVEWEDHTLKKCSNEVHFWIPFVTDKTDLEFQPHVKEFPLYTCKLCSKRSFSDPERS